MYIYIYIYIYIFVQVHVYMYTRICRCVCGPQVVFGGRKYMHRLSCRKMSQRVLTTIHQQTLQECLGGGFIAGSSPCPGIRNLPHRSRWSRPAVACADSAWRTGLRMLRGRMRYPGVVRHQDRSKPSAARQPRSHQQPSSQHGHQPATSHQPPLQVFGGGCHNRLLKLVIPNTLAQHSPMQDQFLKSFF